MRQDARSTPARAYDAELTRGEPHCKRLLAFRARIACSMTKLAADHPHHPHHPQEAPKRHVASGATRTTPARAKAAPVARPRPAVEHADSGSKPDPASDRGFERGVRVRVTSGPFAGKAGVVQELVGRRSARVMLGLLPVQIDLDDLTLSSPHAGGPGGRGRPRLTSSHRKPVPERS
jgi:hypothetical protein